MAKASPGTRDLPRRQLLRPNVFECITAVLFDTIIPNLTNLLPFCVLYNLICGLVSAEVERQALLAFKQSTANNKQRLANWEWNKPTCTWKFVTCSSDGRVTEL